MGVDMEWRLPIHHTVVLVDVARSGQLIDQHQLRMRADLRTVLARTLAYQHLQWTDLHRDDLGDGIRLIVPPTVSPSALLDPFVPTLTDVLREHRRSAPPEARLRLRVAVHMGLVHHDGHGWAGQTLVHVARLINANAVRTTLTWAETDLVVVVSQTMWEAVVAQGYGLNPAGYRRITIAEKETTGPAWIYLPARNLEVPSIAG
jgi:hypothetical protein